MMAKWVKEKKCSNILLVISFFFHRKLNWKWRKKKIRNCQWGLMKNWEIIWCNERETSWNWCEVNVEALRITFSVMHIYIYIYIYIHTHTHTHTGKECYLTIYIYIEREREKERMFYNYFCWHTYVEMWTDENQVKLDMNIKVFS